MRRFLALGALVALVFSAVPAWAINEVWVRERVNFRTSGVASDSAVFSVGAGEAIVYTAPISVEGWGPPPDMPPSATVSSDSVLWAAFEISPAPLAAVNPSCDSLYINTEASWDGTTWFAVTPPTTYVAAAGLAPDNLTLNQVVLPYSGTKILWVNLRVSQVSANWPFGTGAGSTNTVPVQANLARYPLIRFVIQASLATTGQFQARICHWKPVASVPQFQRLTVGWRNTGAAFLAYPGAFFDSTSYQMSAARADTTAPFSLEGFLPYLSTQVPAVPAAADSQAVFQFELVPKIGTTLGFSASIDSNYAVLQVSKNGQDWVPVLSGSGGGNFITATEKSGTNVFYWTFGCPIAVNAFTPMITSGASTMTKNRVWNWPLGRIIIQNSGLAKGEYTGRISGWWQRP